MIDARALGGAVGAVARGARAHRADRLLLAAVTVGYPVWQGVVRTARALDRVVAPGFAAQPIRAPVFVVGHPRSGTTFLHRLLALDPRFCAPRAWQLTVPAVTLMRAGTRAGRRETLRWLVDATEPSLFDGFASRHPTGWHAPEEDDWLLFHAVASPSVELLTGRPELTGHYWLGDELPERRREAVMRWYRRSVQRVLFASAPDATWLSKSPPFTGWLRTLARAFPDARFVLAVRDPEEAIASHLEMTTRAWSRGGAGIDRGDPRLASLFDTSCALYRHAELAWAELPEPRRVRVGYPALVRDPEATVSAVYRHFGWELGDPVREALAADAAAARRRIPGRTARLRQFGIRSEELRRRLGDLDPLWRCLRGAR